MIRCIAESIGGVKCEKRQGHAGKHCGPTPNAPHEGHFRLVSSWDDEWGLVRANGDAPKWKRLAKQDSPALQEGEKG